MVYDEGHLFDDATRGVSYELLLSSIKAVMPAESQTLLVSAALTNVEDVAAWLLGDSAKVIRSDSPFGTDRSIGYVSWLRPRAVVEYPEIQPAQPFTYFVPRVFSSEELGQNVTFPSKGSPNEIALALTLRLAPHGAVAIFCGRKDTASNIVRRFTELQAVGLNLENVLSDADAGELERIALLIEANLGPDSELADGARAGILCHHAGVPEGLRVAVEYAIRNGLARAVVCTSTLAQGVNLPIRYLIMTSHYQAGELMRTRDFVNLMGRAGRADRFTEGSVIFADPRVFDGRTKPRESWRWQQSLSLIDPDECEDCSSGLLDLLKPLVSDDGGHTLTTDPFELVHAYLDDDETYLEFANDLSPELIRARFSSGGLTRQLLVRLGSLRAIQSFLLANSEALTANPGYVDALVESTLAWSLADEDEGASLKKLFQILWEDAQSKVPSPESRQVFGRTMLSATECARIEAWLDDSLEDLLTHSEMDGLAAAVWPLLKQSIRHRTVAKSTRPDLVVDCLLSWLSGEPFHKIAGLLGDARIQAPKQSRRYKMVDVVDMCQNAFGYEANLVLGATVELLAQREEEALVDRLAQLQRRLKHGVATEREFQLYEIGFSDRTIAQKLASLLQDAEPTRDALVETIANIHQQLVEVAAGWPEAFQARLARLARRGGPDGSAIT